MNRPLLRRVVWTCLIHLAAAALFLCIYAVPAFFSYVQRTDVRIGVGRAPMGIILLVLPALLVTFLWGGCLAGENTTKKKILLSLWLIVNVCISGAYLIAIHAAWR